MNAKNATLQQLSNANQRQLVEALADSQALLDQHPMWAVVAMLGVVVNECSKEAAETRSKLPQLRVEISRVKDIVDNHVGLSGEINESMSQLKLALSDSTALETGLTAPSISAQFPAVCSPVL